MPSWGIFSENRSYLQIYSFWINAILQITLCHVPTFINLVSLKAVSKGSVKSIFQLF